MVIGFKLILSAWSLKDSVLCLGVGLMQVNCLRLDVAFSVAHITAVPDGFTLHFQLLRTRGHVYNDTPLWTSLREMDSSSAKLF